MPANPAGSDSSERESCDGCDKDIAAKDGTVLGANIYCEACVAKMGASYLPDDHEFLRDLLVRESATPQTDACDVARAIIAAGFTRAHHDGERVAALEKERDAAWWLLEKHPQEIIGILKAERDALAAKLAETEKQLGLSDHACRARWTMVEKAEIDKRFAEKDRDAAIARAGEFMRQRNAAESRAAALEAALREIEAEAIAQAKGAAETYRRTGAAYDEGWLDAMSNVEDDIKNVCARAALAGNGTGA